MFPELLIDWKPPLSHLKGSMVLSVKKNFVGHYKNFLPDFQASWEPRSQVPTLFAALILMTLRFTDFVNRLTRLCDAACVNVCRKKDVILIHVHYWTEKLDMHRLMKCSLFAPRRYLILAAYEPP